MANYPQELAQDAVCQSHTGHMTGLWFLPARPLRLNTNEWMNEGKALKKIHVILTETLACFLRGRAKDLSASSICTSVSSKQPQGMVKILESLYRWRFVSNALVFTPKWWYPVPLNLKALGSATLHAGGAWCQTRQFSWGEKQWYSLHRKLLCRV